MGRGGAAPRERGLGERQRARPPGRASASEPDGDGAWGRSPQGERTRRPLSITRSCGGQSLRFRPGGPGAMEQFFETSIDMLAVAGLDGRFERINPAWSRVLGFTDDQILDSAFMTFVHPDDAPRTSEQLELLSRPGAETVVDEIRLRCKDGSHRWM